MADAGKGRARERPGSKGRGGGKTRRGGATRKDRARAESRANLIWAIAHPVRRCVLRDIADHDEPRSPMQMSREFDLPVSAVAYHVTILRKFGAVEPAGERMARGAIEHFYASTIADDPPIETLLDETRLADEQDL